MPNCCVYSTLWARIANPRDPEDFQKIHPEILNTTKEALIESTYQSLKNKF